MLEKYLINLYKNINIYSNLTTRDISILKNVFKFNKNIHQSGGSPNADIINLERVFASLFTKIQNDITEIKFNPKINKEELEKKLKVFTVINELYNSYLNEFITQHEKLGAELSELNKISENKTQHKNIEQITNMFNELLGT